MSVKVISNRDQARAAFKKAGLTYNDIGSKEIAKLTFFIKRELKIFNKNQKSFKIHLNPKTHKKNIFKCKYSKNGGIAEYYLRCSAYYFGDREAISFNPDGFIGFAGWASEGNAKPFIDAFIKWVEDLKK